MPRKFLVYQNFRWLKISWFLSMILLFIQYITHQTTMKACYFLSCSDWTRGLVYRAFTWNCKLSIPCPDSCDMNEVKFLKYVKYLIPINTIQTGFCLYCKIQDPRAISAAWWRRAVRLFAQGPCILHYKQQPVCIRFITQGNYLFKVKQQKQ